jgi:hypothetical protein
MPAISLTDFVDFVTRTGNPRLTKVRQVRGRGAYHPAFDFWRGLRQAIVSFHKKGGKDLAILDRAVKTATDPRKRALFPVAVENYKRFIEKKRIQWFDPPKESWQVGGLVVRINPELGLRFDGQSYVIKLNFREEELTKQKIEVILLLMEEALREYCVNGERFAILDVRNGNFITAGEPNPRLVHLLNSEAGAFMSMWDSLDAAPHDERPNGHGKAVPAAVEHLTAEPDEEPELEQMPELEVEPADASEGPATPDVDEFAWPEDALAAHRTRD